MSINFRDAVPAIVDPLERAAQADWVRSLNETAWLFAMVETAHLLFLVVLGGAVAVLNLRLLGAVLRDVPEREVEAATRPWFLAGVIGTVATGIYMGVATIVTLLPSGAFFVKMVALIAAIGLSHATARRVRHGVESARRLDPLAGLALVLWLGAFALFATTTGLGAGAGLTVLAGLAIVIAVALTGGTAGLTAGRLGALSSLLAWMTVAAAGRWIGFS
jgi:hypothetical protein